MTPHPHPRRSGIGAGLWVLALAAALGLAGAARAEQRQISVTGQAEVMAAPDMAVITLGVTNEDPEAGAAMRATSDAVARILGRLGDLGIDPRDMQTRQITLSPVWSEPREPGAERRRITGFMASNTLSLRVRDLGALGPILDAVIADGANEFNGLRFGVQDPEPLQEEARRRAVADAMAKARTLAEAAGVTLGPVMSITEHRSGGPVPMAEMAMRDMGGGAPVAAGEIGVDAQVSLVFAIAD